MAKRKSTTGPHDQPELPGPQDEGGAAAAQSTASDPAGQAAAARDVWERHADLLADAMRRGWKDGRIPLFLFGARGTPIVIREYDHARAAIAGYEALHGEGSYEGTSFAVMEEFRDVGVPRPVQARFFGDLKTCNRGAVWELFCRSFLTDWVVRFLFRFRAPQVAGESAAPDELEGIYGRIREYLIAPGGPHAIILTTNFDGAVPEYIKRSSSGSGGAERGQAAECFVLESAKSIERLALLPGGRPGDAKGGAESGPKAGLPWVITLRGDVYHALCRNKLCSMRERPVSVYDAFSATTLREKGLDAIEWPSDVAEVLGRAGAGPAIAEWTQDGKLSAVRFEVDGTGAPAGEAGKTVALGSASAEAVGMVVDGILKCPECGGRRALTISFPGQEKKEEEISELMSALWEAVGTRISVICTVGFSGNSDREVVNFLARFANRQRCHWFDWSIRTADDGSRSALLPHVRSASAVMEVGQRHLRDERFHRVEAPAGAVQLSKALPTPPAASATAAASQPTESEVMADLLWVEDTLGDRDVAVPVDDTAAEGGGDAGGAVRGAGSGNASTVGTPAEAPAMRPSSTGARATLKMRVPDDIARLFDLVRAPNTQSIDMLNTSQLAMKDYWWNPLVSAQPKHDPRLHSRMHHSVGFMRVADAWFRYMVERPDTPRLPGGAGAAGEWHRCLLQAALLHDVGHSPFSHLLEEVFNELHWSLDGKTRFHHEDLTQSRSLALLREFDEVHRGRRAPSLLDSYSRMTRLLDGVTGIHWLDAIVNGPFDADKIDYVFRDQRWLGVGGRQGDCMVWFSEFLAGQRVSPHGHIFLNGTSASAAYRILAERCHLYDSLYYAPKVRVMERVVQYILASFFVLRVSNRVTRRVCDMLRDGSRPNVESLLLDKRFVDGILSDGGDGSVAGDKGGGADREAADARRVRAQLFVEALFEHAGRRARCDVPPPSGGGTPSDTPEGRAAVSDLGMVKLAYSVAELQMLIDSGFPRLRRFSAHRQLRSQQDGRTPASASSAAEGEHALERFLGKRKLIEVAELQLIAEIGLWALEEMGKMDPSATPRGGDGGGDTGETSLLEGIADACVLVLDPMHGQPPSGSSALPARQEDSAVSNGRWLNRMLRDHCIGGPYVLRAPASMSLHEAEDWLDSRKAEIVEIGRELSYQYPGRILVDVTGPLKVRSYPRGRVMHGAQNVPFICEQFWVPAGDPQGWSVTSEASVPLYSTDFRQSVPQAYKLRVLLVDPRQARDGRANVRDRFRKACRDRRIALEEEDHG